MRSMNVLLLLLSVYIFGFGILLQFRYQSPIPHSTCPLVFKSCFRTGCSLPMLAVILISILIIHFTARR